MEGSAFLSLSSSVNGTEQEGGNFAFDLPFSSSPVFHPSLCSGTPTCFILEDKVQ